MQKRYSESNSLDRFSDGKGGLVESVWPGGYPIVYIDKWGDCICAKCANAVLQFPILARSVKTLISHGEVFFEGPDEVCARCNDIIESAYGDPNQDI